MPMSCPLCLLSAVHCDFCDNDCGTYVCSVDGAEFYFDNGAMVQGHSPLCGVDTTMIPIRIHHNNVRHLVTPYGDATQNVKTSVPNSHMVHSRHG